MLDHCQFRSNALFRGATVQKKWQADASRFEGRLDLSKAKLHDFVYLEHIEQGEKQQFAFANTIAERILIRAEQLPGRLASEAERSPAYRRSPPALAISGMRPRAG